MAAINKEFLLQLNLFVLLAIMRQQKKRKKHRFWVREIFQERQELGAYHRLIMGRVVSFPVVFCRRDRIFLSQRHCRFLFISVVAGLLILLQRQVTTDNDLMETRLKRNCIIAIIGLKGLITVCDTFFSMIYTVHTLYSFV